MRTETEATIEDLRRVPEVGKAELVDGELVIMSPAGGLHYFAAGTQVVWDVDLMGDETIRVYRASDPENATIYRRGEMAEAEPAVSGWTMPVDDLFPKR